ncbi:MAG: hypothetical protein HFI63_03380 [Lachnospiraceae bacterium]|nr:hypothetical protein [Lachnospiraceae bacterium]
MHMDELLRRIYYLKSYKGYPCLVSCIKRVKEDESRLYGIRKQVYCPVAREHGVKLENLEKNLRTMRDIFQIRGGTQLLETQLGGKQDSLYPRELIEALAECITDM